MRWLVPAVVLLGALFVACKLGGSIARPTDTPAIATATQAIDGTPTPRARDLAREAEADDDPSLPGEYVNLPAIYGGYYGNPNGTNTAAHIHELIDYQPQGLPPAGGPHWGSRVCPADPAEAPLYCGPVPWGIYSEPWHAESLVHNMEHAGFVIWYNTTDQSVIDEVTTFATAQLRNGTLLVLTPYPDMEPETIAITVWSRRDRFPAGDYDPVRLRHFIDVLRCRFDPEQLCQTNPAPSGDNRVSAR